MLFKASPRPNVAHTVIKGVRTTHFFFSSQPKLKAGGCYLLLLYPGSLYLEAGA